MKKNLVLIGMMGSGKSTVGKEISKKSALKFKDIDKLIETHEKMKIRDIFDKKGEKFFRSIEEKIVLQTIKLPSQVIALGGGSFINVKIRSEIFKSNISFGVLKKDRITKLKHILIIKIGMNNIKRFFKNPNLEFSTFL